MHIVCPKEGRCGNFKFGGVLLEPNYNNAAFKACRI